MWIVSLLQFRSTASRFLPATNPSLSDLTRLNRPGVTNKVVQERASQKRPTEWSWSEKEALLLRTDEQKASHFLPAHFKRRRR